MEQKEAWNNLYRKQNRPWRGSSEAEFPFSSGDHVLDIGCGNGKSSLALLELGCIVTGVDFSEESIKFCSKNLPEMRSVCSSAVSLPFFDEEFDGIVMNHVLEHLDLEETEKAISESLRVLKRNGKLFVRSFSKDDMRSSEDEKVKGNGIRYRYFNENEIKELFSSFVLVSVSTVTRKTKFGGTRSRVEGMFRRT